MEKGQAIRFVKGTYAGQTGWYNSVNNTKSGIYCSVIVPMKSGAEKATRVLKSSIRAPFADPTTFEEAALQQHPDLELAMINLAEMFVQCGVTRSTEAMKLLDAELTEAYSRFKLLGNKARYRGVDFHPDNEDQEDGDVGLD